MGRIKRSGRSRLPRVENPGQFLELDHDRRSRPARATRTVGDYGDNRLAGKVDLTFGQKGLVPERCHRSGSLPGCQRL